MLDWVSFGQGKAGEPMRGEVERRENFLSRKTSREARPREWPALLQKLSLLWMIQTSLGVILIVPPPKALSESKHWCVPACEQWPLPGRPNSLVNPFPPVLRGALPVLCPQFWITQAHVDTP